MYLVISLLGLRAGCGISLCRFLIIAYLFTLFYHIVSYPIYNRQKWSRTKTTLLIRKDRPIHKIRPKWPRPKRPSRTLDRNDPGQNDPAGSTQGLNGSLKHESNIVRYTCMMYGAKFYCIYDSNIYTNKRCVLQNPAFTKHKIIWSFLLYCTIQCQSLSTIDSDAVSEKLCLQQHKRPNYCPFVKKWQLTCRYQEFCKEFVIRWKFKR